MDYQQQPPPSSDPSPSPSERPAGIASPETPSNNQSQEIEDIMGCVTALEAALLPCLPARELQAIDRSPHPSHQIDVERHARDFMEAAKKLQLYFMGLKREDHAPTRAESLKKEIAIMEEELKTKDELIKKHTRLIQESQKLVKEQIEKHRVELEKSSRLALMEKELKTKDELVKKHTRLIQKTQKLVKEQIEKHEWSWRKVQTSLKMYRRLFCNGSSKF